jgi:hypothetical protein
MYGEVASVHAMKACTGPSGIATLILNVGAEWRCVVNFMPLSL